MNARRRQPVTAAGGYTLVEMLIVIAIISLLIALSVPVVAGIIGRTREGATKVTMKKLAELLQKRQDAFERGFPDFFRQKRGRAYQPANPNDVMFKKRTFQRMFEPGGRNSVRSPADSAEMLYRLITDTDTFGTAAEDAEQFTAAEVNDTDGDGRMEFVDGWGNPIRYYPYPTRLFKPDGNVPSNASDVDRTKGARVLFNALLEPDGTTDPLDHDPDDPYGVLPANAFNETSLHTPQTYHVPLVVSAGPDERLGLFEPHDRANFGHLAKPNGNTDDLYDNISNHNITAGAGGN